MRDFSLKLYKKLLIELIQAGYGFITFAEFVERKPNEEKLIILRHDVDKKPLRALRTAEMENEMGIKGTYYFRVIKNELPGEVIERIAKMGHEIGYHYDDLNAAGGVAENALDLFQKNLAKLRELAPVKTACMHGSPLSKHDNKDLWRNFDYRDFGIIAEPYFDIDFKEVLYLTDTGRRWDGDRVSIRDKVSGDGRWARGYREDKRGERLEAMGYGEDRKQKTEDIRQKEEECRGVVYDPPVLHQEIDGRGAVSNPPAFRLYSTTDIICALNKDLLPDKVMLTIHPQRWTDQWLPWIWELGWQNVKNGVKYFLVRKK